MEVHCKEIEDLEQKHAHRTILQKLKNVTKLKKDIQVEKKLLINTENCCMMQKI